MDRRKKTCPRQLGTKWVCVWGCESERELVVAWELLGGRLDDEWERSLGGAMVTGKAKLWVGERQDPWHESGRS